MRVRATIAVVFVGALVALSGTARAGYIAEVAADNPVIWYRLNETAGSGTAVNSGIAGASFNTNTVGSPVFGAASMNPSLGTAVDQTGQTGHFDIPGTTNHYSTYLDGASSLEFVIKTTQSGGGSGWNNPSMMGEDNSTSCCGGMGGGTDSWWGSMAGGNMGITWGNGANDVNGGSINDGLWHHIVMTRASSGSGDAKIYVDGVLKDTQTMPATNYTYKRLGVGSAGASGRRLDAVYDEVAIYNTVLSLADVQRHFNAIPEPSTFVLAAIGLLGLLGWGRRKRFGI